MDVTDDPPATPGRPRPLLVIVAELISIFTLLGFLIALNICIDEFAGYGLDFLKVATTSDVITTALARSWWLITVGTLASLICMAVSHFAVSARRDLGLLAVSLAFLVIPLFWVGRIDIRLNLAIMLSALACVISLAVTLAFRVGKFEAGVRIGRHLSMPIVILLMASVYAFLPHVYGRINRLQDANPMHAVQDTRCGEVEIIWIGERVTLARCGVTRENVIIPTSRLPTIVLGSDEPYEVVTKNGQPSLRRKAHGLLQDPAQSWVMGSGKAE
ncbi:MAG: hypothetical protein EPO51_06685 [Phenylobacterium sp.]|uniref:hypothetical protein n=1 Tax=Phenylobacterium sp. TaxID=1871053 RepID=UPI0011F7E74F|nr:hypothetical protein [Phenylobacterium sp.]TAJ73317.1 MAG: hypothetical protein EPO51_06685 [Phenylobacterium sp.]